jgi:hypothetical protein
MKYAAVIERDAGGWQLSFPDVPGYLRRSRVANALLTCIEDDLFDALHQHVAKTGGMPEAAHDGMVINVRPADALRLGVMCALAQLNATTADAIASLLGIHVSDAESLLDCDEWVDANTLFRYLEKLRIGCDLTFESAGDDLPAPKKAAPPKKRGRPRNSASKAAATL